MPGIMLIARDAKLDKINIKHVGDNEQVVKMVFVRLWEVWRKFRQRRQIMNIEILISYVNNEAMKRLKLSL